MQNMKLKIRALYFIGIAIAIIISVGIVSVFGFRYLAQIQGQFIRNNKMFIQTHRRIDFLEKRLEEKCLDQNHKSSKPVNL